MRKYTGLPRIGQGANLGTNTDQIVRRTRADLSAHDTPTRTRTGWVLFPVLCAAAFIALFAFGFMLAEILL